jgi:hypothetical protein
MPTVPLDLGAVNRRPYLLSGPFEYARAGCPRANTQSRGPLDDKPIAGNRSCRDPPAKRTLDRCAARGRARRLLAGFIQRR